jgi:hypothetical protein
MTKAFEIPPVADQTIVLVARGVHPGQPLVADIEQQASSSRSVSCL